MADVAGWALMLATFALVAIPRPVRRSAAVTVACWAVLLLHHAVAIVNAYVFTVPGGELDAAYFHASGAALASGEITSAPEFYIDVLAAVYSLAGPSHLLGEELSILAFTFSLMIMVALMGRLEQPVRPGIVVLFGGVPSVVIFSSITMREAWQTLFVVLAAYAAVRMRQAPGWKPIGLLIVAAAGMTLFHHGLAIYAAFTIGVSFYSAYWPRLQKRLSWRRVAGVAAATVILMIWAAYARDVWRTIPVVLSGDVLGAVAAFRNNAMAIDARTSYGLTFDPSSVLQIVTQLPLIFVYYMFAPFPWQVQTAPDLLVVGENLLRFLLLGAAWRRWRTSSGEMRGTIGVLLLMFCIAEAIWAVGTLTWGTAFRHHVPAHGVLVMLGAPLLVRWCVIVARDMLSVLSPPADAARV